MTATMRTLFLALLFVNISILILYSDILMIPTANANLLRADPSALVINEVDADTPGDDTAEFVELYDGGTGNTVLNGY
ncbi:MAG: hypothetical protein KDE19_12920, partial [Caldilineaceae bacterium]|nr:hypothetical protein [Caldilineaceae bacterium]